MKCPEEGDILRPFRRLIYRAPDHDSARRLVAASCRPVLQSCHTEFRHHPCRMDVAAEESRDLICPFRPKPKTRKISETSPRVTKKWDRRRQRARSLKQRRRRTGARRQGERPHGRKRWRRQSPRGVRPASSRLGLDGGVDEASGRTAGDGAASQAPSAGKRKSYHRHPTSGHGEAGGGRCECRRLPGEGRLVLNT